MSTKRSQNTERHGGRSLQRDNHGQLTTDQSVVRLADHGFEDFGVALDGDDDGALLDAVGGAGDDGEDLSLVGHRLADGEGAVGTELDGLAANGDLGVGFGAAG